MGITITSDDKRLSKEEIEKMVQDAKENADEDQKARELVGSRNELEGFSYTLKNQAGDSQKLGGKLSPEEKGELADACEAAIKFVEENSNNLEAVAHPITSKYASGGDSGAYSEEAAEKSGSE